MGKLSGKVGIITGGGRGIGRAVVDRLANEGVRLVINDLDESPAELAAAAARNAGTEAIAMAGSITRKGFARISSQRHWTLSELLTSS